MNTIESQDILRALREERNRRLVRADRLDRMSEENAATPEEDRYRAMARDERSRAAGLAEALVLVSSRLRGEWGYDDNKEGVS